MIRASILCAGLVAFAVPAVAQSPQAVQSLLKTQYALAGEEQLQEFVSEARRLGYVTDRAGILAAKELFLAHVQKNAESIAAQRQVREMLAASLVGGGTQPTPNAITETEFNDLAAWADTFVNADTGTGTLGTGDSRDVYRWIVTQDANVDVTLTTSITSIPALTLVDADGRFVLAGSLVGTQRTIRMGLPAGTYYVAVGTSTTAQTYTLTTTTTATTFPILASGVPVNGGFTLNPEVHTYRLVVGADSDVNVNMTNQGAGTADFFFNFARSKGGRIHFQDDTIVPPATTASPDPILNAQLPAGVYYVFAQEFFSSTTALYTITATVTPAALRTFPCGGTANDTFVDGSNRFLYRLTLTANDRITASNANGVPAPSAQDSYFELFDANMGLVVHNDDSTGRSFLSLLDVSLPAGTYYFGTRTFSQTDATELGQYVLTGVCSQAPTFVTLEAMRSLPLGLAVDSHIAFTYAPRTDSPLRVQSTLQVSLLSSTGTLRAYYQLAGPGALTEVSTLATASETLYGVLRTASNTASAAATAIVQGGLTIDPRGTTLLSLDKAGRTHALFAGLGAIATPFPSFIPGITGNILLDINQPVFAIGTGVIAPNGRITWPFGLNNLTPPIRLQAISIDAALTGGYFTILTP
jgi:hypothetical protein